MSPHIACKASILKYSAFITTFGLLTMLQEECINTKTNAKRIQNGVAPRPWQKWSQESKRICDKIFFWESPFLNNFGEN